MAQPQRRLYDSYRPKRQRIDRRPSTPRPQTPQPRTPPLPYDESDLGGAVPDPGFPLLSAPKVEYVPVDPNFKGRPFVFMSLPPETRQLIYRYLFRDSSAEIRTTTDKQVLELFSVKSTSRRQPAVDLQIRQTCRAICDEVSDFVHECTMLKYAYFVSQNGVPPLYTPSRFLATHASRMDLMISIFSDGSWPRSMHFEFLEAFKNLVYVRVCCSVTAEMYNAVLAMGDMDTEVRTMVADILSNVPKKAKVDWQMNSFSTTGLFAGIIRERLMELAESQKHMQGKGMEMRW